MGTTRSVRPFSGTAAFARATSLAILTLAAILCSCFTALADGKIFVPPTVKVRIPDQSALITFDGKTERLVIETTAESEGNDFAWIVPVPAVPKVEKATAGLFPTLRVITRPRVVPYWPSSRWHASIFLCITAGILIWMGIFTRRWLAVLLVAICLAAAWWVIRVEMKKARPEGAAKTAPVGGAAGGLSASPGVIIHDRHIVGAYDTVTLSGQTGKAVTDWLTQNGFAVPGAVQPALDQYAKDGWVFVAAKLRRAKDAPTRFTPHPLALTFPAKRAVYPMRLTGIDNGPLAVALYVAGNAEATAKSFARQRTGYLDFDMRPSYESGHYYSESTGDSDHYIPIFHSALRTYCRDMLGMTLLTATLSPEQMKEDIDLDWKPIRPFRYVYHAREEVVELACRWASWVFLGCTLACFFPFARGRKAYPRLIAKLPVLFALVLCLAGLTGGETLLMHDHFAAGASLIIVFVVFSVFAVFRLFWRPTQPDAASWRSRVETILLAMLAATLIAANLYFGAPRLFTASVAGTLKWLGIIVGVAFLIVLLIYRLLRTPYSTAPRAARYALASIILVVGGVWLGIYLSIPSLPASQVTDTHRRHDYADHWSIAHQVADKAASAADTSTVDALRKSVAMALADKLNPVTSTPVREEDSPGNYLIGQVEGKPAYFYYDQNGRRRLLGTFTGGKFTNALDY